MVLLPRPTPRPLHGPERDTILAVLAQADFPGRDGLVFQVPRAQAVSGCDCGCATIGIAVVGAPPRALDDDGAPLDGVLPNEGTVLDGAGELWGGLMISAQDGYLSGVELFTIEDSPISPFPPPHQVRPGWS